MSSSSNSQELLERIHAALEAARAVPNRFTPGAIGAEYKVGHDQSPRPTATLTTFCARPFCAPAKAGSRKTVDDFTRLDKQRVWVVDPLDGTREFVHGIPEFFVSMVTSTSSPKVSWDYTEHAPHYDKRADYSCDAIKNLLKAIGCVPSRPVADIGAGTGKLTKALLKHGLSEAEAGRCEKIRTFRL